jgi:hypothetical protein
MARREFSHDTHHRAIVERDAYVEGRRCCLEDCGRKKTGAGPALSKTDEGLLLAVCGVLELFATLLDVLAGTGERIATGEGNGECKGDGDQGG